MKIIRPITVNTEGSFTRASTAMYYDGTTTVKAGENLLLQSQDFNLTPWTLSRASITSNTQVAPDGTTTADTLTADGTSGLHNVRQLTAVQPAHTVSVYAKAGTATVLQFYRAGSSNVWANFDLSTGTLGTVGVSSTASIIYVGNGWYHCVLSTTLTVVSDIYFNIVSTPTSVRAENNTSTGAMYLWGAQLEQRANATTYTPTTTQAITNYMFQMVAAAVDEPRFDHNFTIGTFDKLLLEEQRTNQILNSGLWNKLSANDGSSFVTQDFSSNPIGSSSIALTTKNGDRSAFYQYATNQPVTANVINTRSFFIKPLFNITQVGMSTSSADKFYFRYTLATGQLTLGINVGSVVVQVLADGWYRFSVTQKVADANTVHLFAIVATCTTDTVNPSSFLSTGYQSEAGSTSTSYIPTTTTAVTRSADVLSGTGLAYSNVPENDYPAWVSGTTYALADRVIRVSTHKVYERLIAGAGTTPPESDAVNWREVSPTNRWKLFDNKVGTRTTITSPLRMIVNVGRFDSVAVIGARTDECGLSVTSIADGLLHQGYANFNTGSYSGVFEVQESPLSLKIDAFLPDEKIDFAVNSLYQFTDAYLAIEFKAGTDLSNTVSIGGLILGKALNLGETQLGATSSITDYSIKSVDTFGKFTITQRDFSKKVSVNSLNDADRLNIIVSNLNTYRANFLVWLHNEESFTSLITYGFYKDWGIKLDDYNRFNLALDIEGLV